MSLETTCRACDEEYDMRNDGCPACWHRAHKLAPELQATNAALLEALEEIADAANDMWALLNHNPDEISYGDKYDKGIHRLNRILGEKLREHAEAIRKGAVA